jgi:hypothetical protein
VTRYLFAGLLVAHGIAHLVGFVMPWGLMPSRDVDYPTTVLNGSVDLGETGARVFGVLWLALAIAFIVVGGAVFAGSSDGVWVARLAGLSLVFCVLAWPDARIGAVVNIAIIGAVFMFRQLSAA